jgi:glycerate-2-kinase
MIADSDGRQGLVDLFDRSLEAVRGRPAVRRELEVRGIEGPVTLLAVGKTAQSITEGFGNGEANHRAKA